MRLSPAMCCVALFGLMPAAVHAEPWRTAEPSAGTVAAAQMDDTGSFMLLVSCSGETGLYIVSVMTAPDGLADPGAGSSLTIDLGEESFEFPVKYANKEGHSGVVLAWDVIGGDDFYFDMLHALGRATAPIKLDIADTHLSFDHDGVAAALEAVDTGCM